MEPPPPSYLDGLYPADGVDWTKFTGTSLSTPSIDMGPFAHAWAPLERRWEAGGASNSTHASVLYNATQCATLAWKPGG
jgi:hypothetical protein